MRRPVPSGGDPRPDLDSAAIRSSYVEGVQDLLIRADFQRMQALRGQSRGAGLVQSLFGLVLLFGSEISLGKMEILGGSRGPAHGLLEILEGVLDVPRLEVDDASRVEQF